MTPADEAIARRLRVQCDRFGWMGGMLVTGPSGEARITDVDDDGSPWLGDFRTHPEDVPIPHDPATVGCFAAMARKATGRPLFALLSIDGMWDACVAASFGENEPFDETRWVQAPTEIEAWLAVLEAMP